MTYQVPGRAVDRDFWLDRRSGDTESWRHLAAVVAVGEAFIPVYLALVAVRVTGIASV
jgi:hypothetical protein